MSVRFRGFLLNLEKSLTNILEMSDINQARSLKKFTHMLILRSVSSYVRQLQTLLPRDLSSHCDDLGSMMSENHLNSFTPLSVESQELLLFSNLGILGGSCSEYSTSNSATSGLLYHQR
jgi:hypothetical protein